MIATTMRRNIESPERHNPSPADPVTLMKLRMLADAGMRILSGQDADAYASDGPYNTVFVSAGEAELRRVLGNLLLVLKETSHDQIVVAIEGALSSTSD